MSLVPVFSDTINMEDLTLDFSLDASSADDPTNKFSYDGKNSIGPYRDGYAFGITNIDIDTSLNMQPQIEITFKDLYGNMVFRNSDNNTYSKLFELPPPKFILTFKGYVGQPVQYTLQLRSTSVNYVPSDGSYEIKSKFVPNIYGFFGDIPYKFLYSVDKLKISRGISLSSSSILNIVKNGDIVSEKVQTASDQYAELRNKLTILQGALADGYTLYQEVSGGTFSNNKTSLEVNNIESSIENFQPIRFNFNNKKGNIFVVPSLNEESIYGLGIVRSINSPIKIDVASDGNWRRNTNSLSGVSSDLNKLITDNLNAIDKATQKSAGSQISQDVLNTQTISSVMGSLAGEAAYILGYILEGGLNGLSVSPNRNQNDKLIGKFYPLIYQENNTAGTNGETIYEQIPDPEAIIEMQYVQAFMKAQYEGTQQVQKYKEEQDAKQSGTEGAIKQGSEIKKRLTNAEAFKANPYAGQTDAYTICSTIIKRVGLFSTRLSGPLITDLNTSNLRGNIIDSELQNIKIGTDVLTGEKREAVRTFVNRVIEFFDANGKNKKDWNDKISNDNTQTYQDYFGGLFAQMQGSLSNEMFYNKDPKSLKCNYFIVNDVFYPNENQLETEFGGQDVWVYISGNKVSTTETINPTGTTNISEIYTGENSDKTAPYKSNFFKFKKATDYEGLGNANNPTKMISYEKLTNGSFTSINDLTVMVAKAQGTNVSIVASDNDFVAPFALMADATGQPAPIDYVVDMRNQTMMSYLYSLCIKLSPILPINDKEADQRQQQQDKQLKNTSNGDGTFMNTQNVEPYSFDSNVYNAIYHQFHHIANSWANILSSSLKGQDFNGLANSKKLAETMEEAYRNDKRNVNVPYNMTFKLAVQTSNLTNEMLKKAIINTSSMLETDTESSTFTMMSNIAQQNNFLMQSIPGGLRNDSDEFDIETLFKPVLSYEKTTALGNTSLCFIWQPTPESRSMNNKNEFIYGNTNSFIDSLQTLPGKTAWMQFGSPDNIIVKSIKATTDENKVTGESIAAVDDIINPQNQSKKRAFDCSMLSVMQGRSYKIGMEILGNANFLPTQKFAITNLPIFTGLYWTSNVKHSITPNNMITTIEAIKLKYDGGKFGAVLPVTSDTYKGTTSTFISNNDTTTTNNSTVTENIISDGLNWDFLQKIKNEKMRNSSEINAFIKKYTNNKFNNYTSWFNAKIAKKKQFCDLIIPTTEWTNVWNNIVPILYPNYGNDGINFLEFLAMNMIIYEETGASFIPVSEHVNKLTNEIPGIAYAFNSISGVKTTYNKESNKTAKTLFSDPKFINAHGNLPFGKDNRVLKSQNTAWEGSEFPLNQFITDRNSAVNPENATFINEADFFKFRGRGYIGTTWREGYQKIVEFILSYEGTDLTTLNYKGKFKTAPYNGNVETILTMTSNDDWDIIFRNSNVVPSWAVYNHASKRHNYQYFSDLTQSRQVLERKLYNMGLYVNGDQTGKYENKHMMRVYQQLDELYPSGKVVGDNNGTNQNQSTPPPANSNPNQVTAIKNTLAKLYAPTGGSGTAGMCGFYTVSAAYNYTALLKDPKTKIKEGPFIGGNAKDKSNRDLLQQLGYTVNFVGSKLSKKDIQSKLNSEKWGLGDIAIYWADDRPPGWDSGNSKGSQVIYGHIQIYQGQQFNQAYWATSLPNNYGDTVSFVYEKKPNEEWNLYVCRAPEVPKT